MVGEITKPDNLSVASDATSPLKRGEGSAPNLGRSAEQGNALGISPLMRGENEREVVITNYNLSKPVATRKAYGNALVNIVDAYPNALVLDAEVSNSTYSELVKKNHPEKFIECFIAEQNMVGMALGFSRRGKIPFVSTFPRFDQSF